MARGPRVYLRPLEESDAAALAGFTADETETFFLGRGRIPASPLAFAAWIRNIGARQPPQTLELAVCRVTDDHLLGYVGVWELDWVHGTGEVDIALWPASERGRGYGTEALRLLLDLTFGTYQLRALRAFVWSANARSAAVLTRVGFRPAGRLRTAVVKSGFHLDQLAFDMTDRDWLSPVRAGNTKICSGTYQV